MAILFINSLGQWRALVDDTDWSHRMLKLKGQFRNRIPAKADFVGRPIKLERLRADKTVEVDFFRSALQKDETST
jgi:hypothetical protein